MPELRRVTESYLDVYGINATVERTYDPYTGRVTLKIQTSVDGCGIYEVKIKIPEYKIDQDMWVEIEYHIEKTIRELKETILEENVYGPSKRSTQSRLTSFRAFTRAPEPRRSSARRLRIMLEYFSMRL